MKKALLSILITLIYFPFSNILSAQTLEFIQPTTIPDTVRGDLSDWELTSSPIIKNISNQDVTLKMLVSPIHLTEGHLFAFCDFINCYGPLTDDFESPNTFTIKPNENTGEWIHVYLYPNNIQGASELLVKFTDVNNPDNNISYKAVYLVGTTDVKETIPFNILQVYPNPATNNITINLQNITADEIIITDINGKHIYKSKLNGETFVIINTNNIANGTYLYSIISNGTIKTNGNFTVTH